MNQLRLVVVDGVTELEPWGGMGMEPNDLLNPEFPLIPPVDGSPADVIVQRCACGEVGCGSVTVTIRRVGERIEWTDARADDRPQDIGPFVFDAADYEREVRRAHAERPWEGRDERVARLVSETLAHRSLAGSLSFDWASSWSPGAVVVSVTFRWPNPKAGQPIGPRRRTGLRRWLQGVEPDELFEQHLGVFEIAAAADADAVARIVTQVESTDPKTWPRPPQGW